MVLGNNIFYDAGFVPMLKEAKSIVESTINACVFGYYVNDPNVYSVAEFNKSDDEFSKVEKPELPKSNFAVVSLYFYPNDVVQKTKVIKPSERGELEITSVNQSYLKENCLKLNKMGLGFA